MKRAMIGFLALIPALAQAGHGMIFETGTVEQKCYAKAMIGYDSVINSRVGVAPEHALHLARKEESPHPASGETRYSEELLATVLGAYLWTDSPHSYAISVFFRCAAERGNLTSAQSQWDLFD